MTRAKTALWFVSTFDVEDIDTFLWLGAAEPFFAVPPSAVGPAPGSFASATAQPDLVVSSISASLYAIKGEALGFSYVVQNQGPGPASTTSWGAAYIDQQTTAFTNAWNLTSGLSAGGSQTLSNSFSTAGLSIGTHTLWIKADTFNSTNGQFNSGNNNLAESDETNNWRSVTFDVLALPNSGSRPDLVVTSIAAAATVSLGATLNFSYVVKNEGTGAASAAWSAAYLDQQTTAVTNAWNRTGTLAADGTQILANSISTAGLSLGTHTLWIKTDNFNSANGQFNSGDNDVVESDETDNWRSVTFDVTAADLVVSSLNATASVVQGAALNFSYVVANQGAGAAVSTSWAAAYVDQQTTAFTNSWSQTGALAASGTQTLSNSISTACLSVGTHTLWIKADNFNSSNEQFNSGNNDVIESDESNNWRSVTFNVTTAFPDLVVSAINAPVTVIKGGALNFSYTVANQGVGSTGSTSWAAAYIDQQTAAFTNAWNVTGVLSAGGWQTSAISIDTSALSVGNHTLWIKADNFNSSNSQFNSGNNDVVESNENNNWSSVSFTVAAAADLVVSSISTSASVTQGGSLNFSYVVANQGAGTANSTSWAAAYIDQQVTPVTNSWNLANALAPGAVQTLSNSIDTSGLSVGTHTLWIKADNFNTSNGQFNSGLNDVIESNEANNWRSMTFNVTAPVSAYNITVNFSGDSTYLPYFTAAAAKWQQIIITDLPDVANSNFGYIDDLRIDASVISIDGSGGILGRAGPDWVRTSSLLPFHGVMEFDSADLSSMAANGSLYSVILHEMGHVIGAGTLWSYMGLSSNYQYTGANALAQYRAISGNTSATSVPLETGGGSGTAGAHWSEAVFANELMTGYISGSSNPLSALTVGSLRDMGYAVNYGAADAYTMPGHLNSAIVTDAGTGSTAAAYTGFDGAGAGTNVSELVEIIYANQMTVATDRNVTDSFTFVTATPQHDIPEASFGNTPTTSWEDAVAASELDHHLFFDSTTVAININDHENFLLV